MRNKKNEIYYNAMLAPGMVLLFIFSIVPMFGIIIAFQNFKPALGIFGSSFNGLDNFRLILNFPDVHQVFFNTIYIAVLKIILGLIVPIIFALLLNEVTVGWFKRTVQTVCYLPNFLSWVILAVMFSNIFSYNGFVNEIIAFFGGERIIFMASNQYFRSIIIGTDVWKGFGYGAIVYLAAITNIDLALYESADIDGAGRFKKMWYITMPGIKSTIILLGTLALGNVLNAGFEQIFTMYNPMVYSSVDIIDTYVYRMGLEKTRYSMATAVGLLKSVISFVLIVVSYKLADKFANYKIF